MRFLTMLGAKAAVLFAAVKAVPFPNAAQNSAADVLEGSQDPEQNATYYQTDAAQWVSDAQLCGSESRQHSGYINVGNQDGESQSL
jgi:hypothetical protein